MSDKIKKLVKEGQWQRWQNTNNIHLLSEIEATKAISPGRAAAQARRSSEEEEDDVFTNTPSSPIEEPSDYGSESGLTDLGKAALKANSIWTSILTQLQNFQAGKQLAAQIGQRLASQIDIDAGAGEQIAGAVMKQVLEHLDDLATQDMESEFPGIFLRTRG